MPPSIYAPWLLINQLVVKMLATCMYLMKEAAVPTRSLPGLGLRTSNTSGREREGSMEKTVVLETPRTKQSLIGVESLGTRERGNVRTA